MAEILFLLLTRLSMRLDSFGDHRPLCRHRGIHGLELGSRALTSIFALGVGVSSLRRLRRSLPSLQGTRFYLETLISELHGSLSFTAFQVETVGDCYVAVTGLPDPRKDHALAMARFARDCLKLMNHVLKELEGWFASGS